MCKLLQNGSRFCVVQKFSLMDAFAMTLYQGLFSEQAGIIRINCQILVVFTVRSGKQLCEFHHGLPASTVLQLAGLLECMQRFYLTLCFVYLLLYIYISSQVLLAVRQICFKVHTAVRLQAPACYELA
jgi:hypothetical protein